MVSTRKKKVARSSKKLEVANSQIDSAEFDSILSTDVSQQYEFALEEAFELRREIIVSTLAQRISEVLPRTSSPDVNADQDRDWVPIESLSALRGLVGGRFHNLKQRWIDAGLPLREHRGDKGGDYQVSQEGWIDLANWILKQGYEARLSVVGSESLFELRKIPLE